MAEKSGAVAKVVELVSPIPIDECCRFLRAEMDGPLDIFGTRPVIGRIRGTKFRVRKRIWRWYTFFYTTPLAHTRLTADMTGRAGLTHISCRLSMHLLAKTFMAIWIGGFVLFGGGFLVVFLARLVFGPPQASADIWFVTVLFPIGALVLTVTVVATLQHLALVERQFLLDFVRDTLKANPS